jgi:hypothetical protein
VCGREKFTLVTLRHRIAEVRCSAALVFLAPDSTVDSSERGVGKLERRVDLDGVTRLVIVIP